LGKAQIIKWPFLKEGFEFNLVNSQLKIQSNHRFYNKENGPICRAYLRGKGICYESLLPTPLLAPVSLF